MAQVAAQTDRTQYIGGSDAGVIAGVDPYKTELQLYYEKTGELAEEDISGKEAVQFGIILEDIIAQEYARRTKQKVRRMNEKIIHREHPWMRASIDRDVVSTMGGLECKNTGAFRLDDWGPEGTDEVPERHLLQCQHYMACVGSATWWDLAVLMHGNHLRVYRIERDNELIEDLIELEAVFWQRVHDRSPPAADYTERPKAYIKLYKRLHGVDEDVMQITEELEKWHFVREEARDRIKRYEKVRDGCDAHILELMGTASVMMVTENRGYRRKQMGRAAYQVEKAAWMDFRYMKNPGGRKL